MVMDRRSFLGLAVAAGLSPFARACIKPDGASSTSRSSAAALSALASRMSWLAPAQISRCWKEGSSVGHHFQVRGVDQPADG